MSSWAAPGVKCVCVDATWFGGKFPCPLVEGEVYVIAAVMEVDERDWCAIDMTGAVNVRLRGVWNDDHDDGVFCSNRFRPLITRTQEQDLEQFLPLLNTKELVE